MRQTFYALEIALVEITADVNAQGVTIDPIGSPPERREVRTHYRGDFIAADAQAIYQGFEDTIRAYQRPAPTH
jgi:hypothetical protein